MKKLLGIIVLGLLLGGNAYAETLGCISGDCENGYGKYRWSTHTQEGEWRNGEANGYAIYIANDGFKYEGYYKNHKRNGFGKATWPDGRIYEGQWKNNKMKSGKLTGSNGDYCSDYRKNSCHTKIVRKNNGASESIEFTTSIGKHKNTCKELGFTPGTEKFGDCALKLIELEVAQQGNNKAAQQIQIVQQEAPYDGWMGELGLSLLRGDFNKKVQQPAYKFPTQQHSTCRWQSGGIGKPYMTCTTSPF